MQPKFKHPMALAHQIGRRKNKKPIIRVWCRRMREALR